VTLGQGLSTLPVSGQVTRPIVDSYLPKVVLKWTRAALLGDDAVLW